MENHFSPEDLGLILLGAYLLVILITYLRALKLDKTGVRTSAVIRSFATEEYWGEDTDGIAEKRYRDIAHIEFETKDHHPVTVRIPASRYKQEKYRNKLPIIYPKHNPQKAKIDDLLYIYELPLGLTLIGLVIMLILGGYMVLGD